VVACRPLPPRSTLPARGEYELLRLIAAGGMAEVFLARVAGAAGFSRPVAIKLIHERLAHHPEYVEMFLAEARVAARLDHPNIVQVVDLGRMPGRTSAGSHFLALEYVHGKTLRQVIERSSAASRVLPLEAVFAVAHGVLAALSFAHTRCDAAGRPAPVIHRDVSPQNILISYAGAVKLADFGIAKAPGHARATRDGVVKGNVHYMAPEQMLRGHVDARADLYAFGVVLHECLTGRALFARYSAQAMFDPRVVKEIPVPSRVICDRPEPLDALVLRLLAHDPRYRYRSCSEVMHELERLMLRIGKVASSERLGALVRSLFAAELREEDTLLATRSGSYGERTEPTVELRGAGTAELTRLAIRVEDRGSAEAAPCIQPSADAPPVRARDRGGLWAALAIGVGLLLCAAGVGPRALHATFTAPRAAPTAAIGHRRSAAGGTQRPRHDPMRLDGRGATCARGGRPQRRTATSE
jgi:serine/threonine-protein kinase